MHIVFFKKKYFQFLPVVLALITKHGLSSGIWIMEENGDMSVLYYAWIDK